MTNEKRMVVEVKFIRKENEYTVRLRALHNGAYVVAKQTATGDLQKVFMVAYSFIKLHDATNISMKRGITEDSFAQYIKEQNENENKEAKEALDNEEKDLLMELESCDMVFNVAISKGDYATAIHQSLLKNDVRNTLLEINPNIDEVVYNVDVPQKDSEAILEVANEINDTLTSTGEELFKIEKNRRRVILTKSNIKVTLNLKKELNKNEDVPEVEMENI